MVNDGNIPSNSPLARWGRGKWWKDLREKAQRFEEPVENIAGSGVALSQFISINGLRPDKVIRQLTIEVNGTRVRLDYFGVDESGGIYLGEAKFSTEARNWVNYYEEALTQNQRVAFPLIGSNKITIVASDQGKIAEIKEVLGIRNFNGTYDILEDDIMSLQLFGSKANDYSIVDKVITIYEQ